MWLTQFPAALTYLTGVNLTYRRRPQNLAALLYRLQYGDQS